MKQKKRSYITRLATIEFIIVTAILTTLVACNRTPTLHMIGDSTMANKEKLYLPERGWGQVLPQFFTTSIKIENHAKNGRSTRSFIYEGRWDLVYDELQTGDFVLMQFGHNDGVVTKIGRHSTPEEYEYNLTRFIKETRSKNALPILATPIVRRRFNENNEFYDSHGVYPDIVRKLAKKLDVPLLDLHATSTDFITHLGAEESKNVYLHIEPGVHDSLPNGKIDDTHFSEYGATEMAKLACEQIKQNSTELAKYLK